MGKQHIVEAYRAPLSELRNFAYVGAGFVCGILGVLVPLVKHQPWPWWPWSGAALLAIIGRFAPRALRPIYAVWMPLAQFIGRINSTVILFAVYYGLVTPLAVLRRMLGHSGQFVSGYDKDSKSYQVKSAARSRMEDPY